VCYQVACCRSARAHSSLCTSAVADLKLFNTQDPKTLQSAKPKFLLLDDVTDVLVGRDATV
jgi:hypothetical protein